ncbi:hypothetical protein DL770_011903 [Monosporascus sp. CRB-9-2]|nr:hypothetical protein DL770_011903 [Monosporascus sp. CRB-9-2]
MLCSLGLAALLAAPSFSLAQVVGTPYGFAAGVTGGGNATPQTPADIKELADWLADDTPRVIMIDKTFDFIGSEGTTTQKGCRSATVPCDLRNGGQDWIKDTCDAGETEVQVTYDNAGTNGLQVGSNKSLVGVGDKGVIRGKGLRILGGNNNIIIQNIHFTQLNPEFVWGGDAIGLEGNDGVWIDHCKFSLVGRQMLVTHYESSRVTVSNCEFDGVTEFSSSCNGDHYWTALLYGEDQKITLDRNYFHDVSGRAPKIGGSGNQIVHAVNNYFSNIGGHNFDIREGASVLIEGNVFDGADTPITSDSKSSGASVFTTPDSSSTSTCSGYLRRNCVVNSLTSSGDWISLTSTTPLYDIGMSRGNIVNPMDVSKVADYVVKNAGIGKLGSAASADSAAAPTTKPTTAEAAAPTTTKKAATATKAPASPGAGAASMWAQCGGANWSGPTTCVSGAQCVKQNEWYYQCLEA